MRKNALKQIIGWKRDKVSMKRVTGKVTFEIYKIKMHNTS